MTYTTLDALINAYGEREITDLTDRDRDGTLNVEVVSAAIEQTDMVINGYLRGRFTVPLATTPGLISTCAKHICRYFLSEDLATDRIKEDYERALRWLGEIRDGKLDPGIDQDNAAPEVTSGSPRHRSSGPAFPLDHFNAWSGD